MNAHRLPHCDFDPDDLHTRLRIEVPGRVDCISPAVERVMEEARGMECARGKEFEIETALREALANAIRHGCRNDATKNVEVCVACDETRGMLIVVRDPGPGFEPAEIPSPTIGQHVFRHHGRGIYLINQLMDEVSFGRGGTEIRMRKR
jgi:serine/threonine-protein kinase RsbW